VRLLQLLHSSLLMVADLLVTASQSTDLLEVRIGTLLDVLCKLARLLPAGSSKQLISSSTTAVMNKAGNSMAALAAAAGGGGEGSSKQRAEVAAGAAAVREVALMCLTSVMGLPYHLLHPYR
jgi:2',3'-cyclic-nucleotide 2'-phosphodiesterase (5'-nucleotidase family)